MTVYVVQAQHRFDHTLGQLVPKYDLSRAESYGRLEYLLSPSANPFNPSAIIPELTEKLRNFGDGDCLLLIGNPALIGFATAIAADMNEGRVKLLQWSGKERRYIEISAVVFE